MAGDVMEFTAKEGETSIYLRQVDKGGKTNDGDVILEVAVPSDEKDVLVGLLDHPFSLPWTAGWAGEWLAVIAGFVFLVLLVWFGAFVLWAIAKKEISLKFLIAEPDGKASLSRFQALIFTFVFMIGILLILFETGEFPEEIPLGVLAILGGSLGTYLISKGISGSGTTPGAIKTAPSGPLLRYSRPAGAAQATFDTNIIPVSSEPYKIGIPTTAKGPNNLVPVAVAVGATTLKLSFSEPDGGLDEKKVSYIDGTGKNIQVDLNDGQQIQTPADRITEVSVRFKSKATSGVVSLEVVTV